MGQLVLGIAGAAVGSFIGGPMGASIGWSLGAMAGGMLFNKTQKISQEGPRLQDLRVQVATYGLAIPKLYGMARFSGNVIFSTDIREVATTTTEEVGGKGGPPSQEVSTTVYTHFADFAVGICAGPIAGVRRIWANGKLIYNVGETADLQTILQSNAAAGNMRFYIGDETQIADPTMEATLGVGNVPGHRGLAYIVFNNFQLDQYRNRIPNFSLEVVASATAANLATPSVYNYGSAVQYFVAQNPGDVGQRSLILVALETL